MEVLGAVVREVLTERTVNLMILYLMYIIYSMGYVQIEGCIFLP